MPVVQSLISRMKDYICFLSSLRDVPAEALRAPIADDKWTVLDVVAHIMAWDKNFLKTVILVLEAGEQPVIAEDLNFQAFNEQAADVGRPLTKEQLLRQAADARSQLVEHLQRLPPEAFQTKRQGGVDGDLAEFLEHNFVYHDKHHTDQVRDYFSSIGRPCSCV